MGNPVVSRGHCPKSTPTESVQFLHTFCPFFDPPCFPQDNLLKIRRKKNLLIILIRPHFLMSICSNRRCGTGTLACTLGDFAACDVARASRPWVPPGRDRGRGRGRAGGPIPPCGTVGYIMPPIARAE